MPPCPLPYTSFRCVLEQPNPSCYSRRAGARTARACGIIQRASGRMRMRLLTPENAPRDDASDEAHQAFVRNWLAARAVVVDAVFSSEAYGDTFAKRLGTGISHHQIDLPRFHIPISATAIR